MSDAQESASGPRVFLSYSWTTPEYADRVVELAKRLREAGVDVVLDRVHLTGGQDANAFTERSVTDPSITHVLLLCDPRYAERADGREGGVGTETLIVSPKVYASATQSRFVPVIMERDTAGNVRVPAYVDGRLYYDLSIPALEEANFELLLRHLYGKPEVVLPPLGPRPAFLDDAGDARSPTRQPAAALCAALQAQRPNRYVALEDYLGAVITAIEGTAFAPGESDGETLRTQALAQVDALLPLRDEIVEAVQLVLRYADDERAFGVLHRFFERLANVLADRRSTGYSDKYASPHRVFVARELVLHVVALFLAREQFEGLHRVLGTFYVTEFSGQRGEVRTIATFDSDLTLLDQLPGYHPGNVAVLLARRADQRGPVSTVALREAEVFCAVRCRLDAAGLSEGREAARLWFPATNRFYGIDLETLPLIARLRDRHYRERFARALGARDATELVSRIRALPAFGTGHHPLVWTNAEHLLRVLHLEEGGSPVAGAHQ